MRSAHTSFLYARDKRPLTIDLDGGATDFGLEALPHDPGPPPGFPCRSGRHGSWTASGSVAS